MSLLNNEFINKLKKTLWRNCVDSDYSVILSEANEMRAELKTLYTILEILLVPESSSSIAAKEIDLKHTPEDAFSKLNKQINYWENHISAIESVIDNVAHEKGMSPKHSPYFSDNEEFIIKSDQVFKLTGVKGSSNNTDESNIILYHEGVISAFAAKSIANNGSWIVYWQSSELAEGLKLLESSSSVASRDDAINALWSARDAIRHYVN